MLDTLLTRGSDGNSSLSNSSTFILQVNSYHTHDAAETRNKNCTDGSTDLLRSYIFNIVQLREGYVAINCLVTLYMFGIMAIISAKYFVPAIEKFTHEFHISPSVAGAGIMATAASVPTLANNLVGMFIARNDIGLGAVVGGSFFNLFFIPALCGLAVPKALELNAFPIIRDLVTFVVASVMLLWCIQDKTVTTVESASMIAVYLVYILIVVFTPSLERALFRLAAKTPKRCDCDRGLFAIRIKEVGETTELMCVPSIEAKLESPQHSVDEYRSVLAPPQSFWAFIPYVIFLPVLLVFFFLIPDFQRPGWGRLYPVTILMSLVLIGASAYVTVWMISIIGQVANAPVTVMGMTLLAIGSSLPDAFNSLFAARDGFGEMAMANTLGACNLQILVCLAIPWLLQSTAIYPEYVNIAENFLVPASTLAFAGLVPLFILFFAAWRIGALVSIFFTCMYFACVIPSVAYQGRMAIDSCL